MGKLFLFTSNDSIFVNFLQISSFRHFQLNLFDRTRLFKERASFECICEACTNNYPTFFEAESMKNVPKEFDELYTKIRGPALFEHQPMETIKKMFNLAKMLLSENEEFYPTQEHDALFELLIDCMSVFINKKPMLLIMEDHF